MFVIRAGRSGFRGRQKIMSQLMGESRDQALGLGKQGRSIADLDSLLGHRKRALSVLSMDGSGKQQARVVRGRRIVIRRENNRPILHPTIKLHALEYAQSLAVSLLAVRGKEPGLRKHELRG